MSERSVRGLQPWLPWPLSQSPWWTEPVRAERLAALRIGLAAVLLLDVLWTYLPYAHDYFGPGSLGAAEVFANRVQAPRWNWSPLRLIADPRMLDGAMIAWAGAALLLLVGWWTRFAAVVAWIMAVSVMNLNYYLHNGGDRVRTIALLYLVLAPCGAVWSLDHWLAVRRRRESPAEGLVFVYPWPLRLLFIQMGIVYFFSGIFKWRGESWHAGSTMHYVMGDLAWTRWSFAQFPAPYWLTQGLTWITLVWELGFPLLVCLRPTRTITLLIGVAFHVGTGILLELGFFPLYMLCLYLPLVPWERWVDGKSLKVVESPKPVPVASGGTCFEDSGSATQAGIGRIPNHHFTR